MSNKYGYIYKTTNLVNGKIYIGQHKGNVQSETYLGSGQILWRAIQKYGIENFMNEVIEWCQSEEELNAREIYWIEMLNARHRAVGYNQALGGNIRTIWAKGEMPQEIRNRISNTLKGHTLSQASIEKMRETMRKNYVYRPMNEEGKRKISENAKDRLSIHKDNVEKRVYQHELQSYLDNGWELGGRKRDKRPLPPRVWINNGKINKMMPMEDAERLVATDEWFFGAIHKKQPVIKKRRHLTHPRSDKGVPRKKQKTYNW